MPSLIIAFLLFTINVMKLKKPIIGGERITGRPTAADALAGCVRLCSGRTTPSCRRPA